MSQKGHGCHAVSRHMQIDVRFGVAEGFASQTDVAGTVLDQKNFESHNLISDGFHDFA
jgi:hypothetical protein